MEIRGNAWKYVEIRGHGGSVIPWRFRDIVGEQLGATIIRENGRGATRCSIINVDNGTSITVKRRVEDKGVVEEKKGGEINRRGRKRGARAERGFILGTRIWKEGKNGG